MTMHLPEIVFLDLEASSLEPDGWPVEVGVTWIDELGELVTWSSLVGPHETWSDGAWSAESESVHGIARADLSDAAQAEDVARETVAMIDGRMMVSDAPAFDQKWLDRLLSSAGLARETSLRDFDRHALRHFSGEPLDALYASLTRRRAPNRAGPDSRRLARAWLRGLQAMSQMEQAVGLPTKVRFRS